MDSDVERFFESLEGFLAKARKSWESEDTDWPDQAAIESVELEEQYRSVKDKIKKLN